MKASRTIRGCCGVLGIAGVAAIASNAHALGGLEFDFMLLGSLFGGFLFLYVAFFGELPWAVPESGPDEKQSMSAAKWRIFRAAFVVFLIVAAWFLFGKGVFDEADGVVLGIVGLLFAAVGVALYFFVKDRPDDPG